MQHGTQETDYSPPVSRPQQSTHALSILQLSAQTDTLHCPPLPQGVYAYGADVTKESPSERGRTFARYTGAVAIGNTLGPLVNGLLLDHYGFTAPLAVLMVAGLAILVLLACIPESLSPADHPAAPLDVLRKHNTLAVFCRFLLNADRRDSSSRGGGPGAKPVRRRPAGKPSLLPLAAVFCLCFSDLVGQGTIFLYFARRVFHWRPAWLGWVRERPPRGSYRNMPVLLVLHGGSQGGEGALTMMLWPVCCASVIQVLRVVGGLQQGRGAALAAAPGLPLLGPAAQRLCGVLDWNAV